MIASPEPDPAVSRLLRSLRSLRLTLVLFVTLALASSPGTLATPERIEAFFRERLGERPLGLLKGLGLTDLYGSPLFLALLALLAVNILLCTWHRVSRSRSRGGVRLRPLLDLLTHLSVLLILAGAAGRALFGFVGTQYLLLGVKQQSVYDWKVRAEVPLGFTAVVERIVEDYYPIRCRIGVTDLPTGRKVAMLEAREGSRVSLPGGGLTVEVKGLSDDSGRLEMTVAAGGEEKDLSFSLEGGGGAGVSVGPYGLSLIAYRRDLRRVRGWLRIEEGGVTVREGWLYVNGRVAYRGTSFFQTAWGEDASGTPFIGVQVSRDPAAPLFWAGCILFSLALPLFTYVRHR